MGLQKVNVIVRMRHLREKRENFLSFRFREKIYLMTLPGERFNNLATNYTNSPSMLIIHDTWRQSAARQLTVSFNFRYLKEKREKQSRPQNFDKNSRLAGFDVKRNGSLGSYNILF